MPATEKAWGIYRLGAALTNFAILGLSAPEAIQALKALTGRK